MSSEIGKKEIKKDRVKTGRVGDVKPTAQPVKTQHEKDLEELERLKQEVREDMKRHLKTPFVKRNYDFHKSSIAPEYFERFELYIYSACLIHPYPLCWKRLPDGRVTVFVRPHNNYVPSVSCSERMLGDGRLSWLRKLASLLTFKMSTTPPTTPTLQTRVVKKRFVFRATMGQDAKTQCGSWLRIYREIESSEYRRAQIIKDLRTSPDSLTELYLERLRETMSRQEFKNMREAYYNGLSAAHIADLVVLDQFPA